MHKISFHFLPLLLVQFLLFPSVSLSLNQEGLYLHQLKLSLTDPDSYLSSWSDRDSTPCSWSGVYCDSSNRTVRTLDLSNATLGGPLRLSLICRLQNLTTLILYNNNINSIVESDLATCRNLEHLDVSQNYLTGPLPSTLPELPNLKYLDLSGNNFSGEIPDSFARFPKLEVLSLVYNLLGGRIPGFLGNVSTLKMLNLSYNPFLPARIPPEFGNLTELQILWLTETNLVGQIPDSLGRLEKLTDFDVAINRLVGGLPPSLAGLRSVRQVEVYNNSLSGELPTWLGNLSALRLLDAAMNQFTGRIPDELCRLPLESLNLYENRLEGNIPASIADSPGLYELRLFENRLTGELPKNLGMKSPLKWLDVSSNELSGGIPQGLCENGVLEEVLMLNNSFSGSIPEGFGSCSSLLRVRLGHNQLTGEVAAGLWGLPHVSLIDLVHNSLWGQISKSIGGARNLSVLVLDNNEFNGSIPDEIGRVKKLEQFSASENQLIGALPASIVDLRQLGRLNLQGNMLSGELPKGIDLWREMNELNLARNELTGMIPQGIGNMSLLNYLDLSSNRLTGRVPFSLQDLRLNLLNLSNNLLVGEVPPLYAKEIYKNSFLGNPGLCGDIEGLCDGRSEVKRKVYVWLLRAIFLLAAVVFMVGVVWFYLRFRNFKDARSVDKSKWTLMSFHKLGFNEYEIFDGLDEDNVIGTGLSGKVYKVVLNNGEAVAVKKLWAVVKKESEGNDVEKGQVQIRDDGFEAEITTLGKIRHKNIVKLWCSCVTRDCRLLVYEYMPNGSLGDLLHSGKAGLLDWPIRFKIILDAAEGLSYLHHDCVPPIVHRDIKSNNILLDVDFGAHLADFGVAKAVDSSGKPKSMSGIAGSCGYIAPEYAYTLRVDEKSDIYSFGVVILELVTGKRPVAPEYGEKDLVKWVFTTLDQKRIEDILDPKLASCFKEEICRVLNLGIQCTTPLPINRPSMRQVVKSLQEVHCGENQPKTANKDGKWTQNHPKHMSDREV